jgi:hypothetical protein
MLRTAEKVSAQNRRLFSDLLSLIISVHHRTTQCQKTIACLHTDIAFKKFGYTLCYAETTTCIICT